MKTFSLFGYSVTISKEYKNPIKKICQILEKEEKNGKKSKIELIKILRRVEVSKILIDAGVVPDSEIRKDYDGSNWVVGLAYAKEWVEQNYLNVKR